MCLCFYSKEIKYPKQSLCHWVKDKQKIYAIAESRFLTKKDNEYSSHCMKLFTKHAIYDLLMQDTEASRFQLHY